MYSVLLLILAMVSAAFAWGAKNNLHATLFAFAAIVLAIMAEHAFRRRFRSPSPEQRGPGRHW